MPDSTNVSLYNVVIVACVSGIVFLTIVLIGSRFQGFAYKFLTRNPIGQGTAVIIDAILALFVGIVAYVFRLWDISSYSYCAPPFALHVGAGIWSLLFSCYLALRYFQAMTKQRERECMVKMEIQVKDLAEEKRVALKQRDEQNQLRTCIGSIVEAKMDRLKQTLEKKSSVTAEEFLNALDPVTQAWTIVTIIHRDWARRLTDTSASLRLGIYIRDPDNPRQLRRLFGWDGTRKDCFSETVQKYLATDDPTGVKSAICRCLHSETGILIFPSCEEEAKAGRFQFFYPDQGQHLKSMVVYRRPMKGPNISDVMILTLDTSIDRFFSQEQEQYLRDYLGEMTRRLEFEFFCIAKKGAR